MALLDDDQFQLFSINPLVRCDPHPTADVGVVAGYQEEGTVKAAGLFPGLHLDLEGRLGEKNVDGLKDVGEGSQVVVVEEFLGTRVIGGVHDRCIEADAEVVDENTAPLAADIIVMADVNHVSVLVGEDLLQRLQRLG